jgi:hypothetical protein
VLKTDGAEIWDDRPSKPSWLIKASRPDTRDYNLEPSANDAGIIAGPFAIATVWFEMSEN